MNFELILLVLVVLSGIIYVLNKFIWKKDCSADAKGMVCNICSFFPILLIVLLIRSFMVEPFRIPSASLEPTLLTGDFVVVNKYVYGVRLPVWGKKVLNTGEPKKGDVFVFHWPPNPSIYYIKRVIGVPGDHIVYHNKVLTINDKEQTQKFIEYSSNSDEFGHLWKVARKQETLNGVTHDIYVRPGIEAHDFDVTIPQGYYYAMGDNRDDSADSRYWGLVPEANLVGKAFGVWMSFDSGFLKVRWSRIGNAIH